MVQNVYYYSFHHSNFQYNTYQYGNQILAYDVPTSLPTDYSYSSGYTSATIFGGNGFPTVSRTPYITITNNNFGTFLGFTAGNYPAGGTTGGKSFGTSINYAPAVNKSYSKINNFGTFFGFTAGNYPAGGTTGGKSFGTSINYAPAVPKWLKQEHFQILL